MTLKRNRPLVTATISVAALSMLAACGTRPSLVDYRPVVDSYNTNIATYEGDRTQCVNVAMQAQAEYDRREKEQRQSNMTVGFIIGAIAGAAVGSTICRCVMSNIRAICLWMLTGTPITISRTRLRLLHRQKNPLSSKIVQLRLSLCPNRKSYSLS